MVLCILYLPVYMKLNVALGPNAEETHVFIYLVGCEYHKGLVEPDHMNQNQM